MVMLILEHESAITIAALDITLMIDLEIDARVAQCSASANVGCAITKDAALVSLDGFGRVGHSGCGYQAWGVFAS